MIGLYKENTKIALDSIRSQALRTSLTVMIIAIGITALVGILTVVSALENTILKDFASMGANTFSISQYDFSSEINQNDTEQRVNPIISYPEAKSFQDKFDFPFTKSCLNPLIEKGGFETTTSNFSKFLVLLVDFKIP